jgi:TPR repeat protein
MIRFIAMLAVLIPLAAQAGYDEGVEAYSSGDYAKALTEFRAAADQGNVDGMYFVGMFYHNGYGVTRDQAEAYKWFRKAADLNDPRSQYYVGIMTAAGKGVEKDPVAGAMWLVISARNAKTTRKDAHYTKEEYEKVTKKMTPEQVAQALEMAKNWKPQN